MNDADMTVEEKLAYIDNALANLRVFLTADEPERHALLLTHDNETGEFQSYAFNADPATAMFMLTSAMECIRDEILEKNINRSIN